VNRLNSSTLAAVSPSGGCNAFARMALVNRGRAARLLRTGAIDATIGGIPFDQPMAQTPRSKIHAGAEIVGNISIWPFIRQAAYENFEAKARPERGDLIAPIRKAHSG
jgi:hypothetical protein